MNNTVFVHRALQAKSDDRGYVRSTVNELALQTGLSPSTVKRALTQLVVDGLILRRSKEGRTGGLLIRLETGSKLGHETGSKLGQIEPVDHAFKSPTGSEGALGRAILEVPQRDPETGSRNRVNAYRPAAPHEATDSGAELVYTGPEGTGRWIELSPTLWLDPSGFAVSTKNMTAELKMRIGAQ